MILILTDEVRDKATRLQWAQAWARAHGSTATTVRGIMRVAMGPSRPLQPAAWRPLERRGVRVTCMSGCPPIVYPDRGAAAATAYRRRRSDARYTARGEAMMAALDLRPMDARAEAGRVRRRARARYLADQLASDDERALRDAGYTLTRDPGARRRTLRGVDDGHAFAVQVPLSCGTIAEAIEWLRPDGIEPGTLTLRQGEFFFVPREPEPEGATYTTAGSRRDVVHTRMDSFDVRGRHMPEECLRVEAQGETAFIGRRGVETHDWRGRPRFYVRGRVTHPEHTPLYLAAWHEVIPNRAHGPWPVGSTGGGID